MKQLSKYASVLIIAALLFSSACARLPSEQRSAKLIKNYFHKYSKKFPETVYGQSEVAEVEVRGQQEIHKNFVSVDAFVTLKDGNVQRIFATIEKRAVGWRFASWENATGGS